MADDTTLLHIKLSGGGISPANVRMDTLYGVLGGLERAIEAMAKTMGVAFDKYEAIVTPGALKNSSLAIPTTLNFKAHTSLREIDRAFYTDEIDRLPALVRAELLTLQFTLGQRGVTLEMTSSEVGLHGITLAKDSPHISASDEETLEMTSPAVVYGVCMRINRGTKDAAIKLHDGTSCTLKNLTDEHIQKLMKQTGENLDQVYRIEGQATWNMNDYRIRDIIVVSINPIERDAGELFSSLREVSGNTFDDMDPVDYVNQLRGK